MLDPQFSPRDMTIDEWVTFCHGESKAAGWWRPSDFEDPNIMGCKIALIHSEVSEMLEGLRKGLQDDHLPHRPMEEVEAADIFIRLADYCGARGLDLAGAVIEKVEYNRTRADHRRSERVKPGGKTF